MEMLMSCRNSRIALSPVWPVPRRLVIYLIYLSLTLAASGVWAAVPRTLSVQGVATDRTTGTPLNRTEPVTFVFYDTATSSAFPLWRETQTLTFVDGAYRVVLGADPANPLSDALFSSGH